MSDSNKRYSQKGHHDFILFEFSSEMSCIQDSQAKKSGTFEIEDDCIVIDYLSTHPHKSVFFQFFHFANNQNHPMSL